MAQESKQEEISEGDRLLFEYEFVRRSGRCNMVDRAAVAEFAEEAGFDALLNVAASRSAYTALLKGYKQPNERDYLEWLESEELAHI